MKLRNYLILVLLIGLSFYSIAQETLKIMQYNLLYYGKNVYECNSDNNNIDDKNTYLKTILGYAQPDIFCVNEMDASVDDVDYLMDNTLNIDGVNYWKHASVSGSYSINMMYYNSNKFTLNTQEYITADPRQTDVYHLTYKSQSIDFTVFVVHLKASSDEDSQTDRANATQNIMNYISNEGVGNYIVMGDMNLYGADEVAFQNLINPDNPNIAFYDPIDKIGSWHTNSSYANIHTQSTHTDGDCYVTGGMDDRFDFIMISEAIKDGTSKMKYLPNSYETIGQDGNHYNKDINEGTNDAAPADVIEALYNMSDHIPVSMQVVFGESSVTTVFNKTFDDQDLTSGGWAQYSVTDVDRFWLVPDNTYGHNGTYYTEMTGYDYDNNKAVDNEDWLISPAFNADELSEEVLTFWTAGKYDGPDLQLYYSSNYSGTGNPNDANWTEITGFHLSNTDDYVWESSGNIDISQIVGENVRIGFKYTSSEANGSRKWEIDDILLEGTSTSSTLTLKRSAQKNYLSIYPNPVTNRLYINVNDDCGQKENSVQILDLTGKIILETTISPKGITSVDVSAIKKGIYFVKVGKYAKKLIVN